MAHVTFLFRLNSRPFFLPLSRSLICDFAYAVDPQPKALQTEINVRASFCPNFTKYSMLRNCYDNEITSRIRSKQRYIKFSWALFKKQMEISSKSRIKKIYEVLKCLKIKKWKTWTFFIVKTIIWLAVHTASSSRDSLKGCGIRKGEGEIEHSQSLAGWPYFCAIRQ